MVGEEEGILSQFFVRASYEVTAFKVVARFSWNGRVEGQTKHCLKGLSQPEAHKLKSQKTYTVKGRRGGEIK